LIAPYTSARIGPSVGGWLRWDPATEEGAIAYTFIPDVCTELEIPEQGTLSRVLYRDEHLRVVGFAFDEGQELTEHTAAVPAVLQVLRGHLRVTTGAEEHELHPSGWLHMAARLPHSLTALEPSVALLTMVAS
jgi:quercetin dioxygenase-like cupin family protein